ncbi:DUF2201 family putative metallopeptidase [Ethanoligenens harbinense]|uniref:Metallopeptidase n=1 Tax=Ethanoligenens harbinense (strain DSM 18485 / JCM 12961 / CGMCC 1.5033 / YUAN-3) TaxID=663278 RepID=E6U639_ETHHY|nr:VWA-like domain-containing protein [Ethanoligenens harbinense]ADU25718.1 hypothetical protein Ethha_0131 [Ethanoligenens harbinense YUAN-3]AVQ94889.1 metallopeptidase [Ethanoligenens harbinense YUAN-3]AYF37580.1 metallopeptidase [Ethanoligenens harbinense]AYF40300.1 metallopeptidase [Ethanoligenens harbinense]QCN91137.1 metallopeptidase [Ethanoligenens harbinense]
MKDEKDASFLDRADPLAREILGLTRSAMFVKLRFLDAALGHLPFARQDDIGRIATDGKHLFYNPRFILQRYEESADRLARDCLHLVFHCVLRHPFFLGQVRPAWWNLAVDIAVENTLNELDVFPTGRVHETAAEQVLTELRGPVRSLSAEGLYRYFAREGLDDDSASRLRQLFYHDDHIGWYARDEREEHTRTGDQNVVEQGQASEQDAGSGGESDAKSENRREKEGAGGGEPGQDKPQPGDGNNADTPSDKTETPSGQAPPSPGGGDPSGDANQSQTENTPGQESGGTGEGNDGQAGGKDGGEEESPMKLPAPREDGLFALWKQISRRMQTDLETTSRRWGEESGSLLQSIRGANRDKCDYSAFLRRFSTRGEQMKVNDDEFDYIFYTHGLERYGNMPLIEPLEYKEVRKVREFVIAIDTSASCSGELVQGFVRKTYSILKQQECFFRRLNIHIIQCDAEIQSDVLITCEADLERYIAEQKLHGFGGTDFRPVFAYIDDLLAKHAFFDLRGLVYFSDGYGVFPLKKPPYDTAFVFLGDDEERKVPSWVIPVRMTEEELYDLVEQPETDAQQNARGGDEKEAAI